ncbi:MAG: hypothetical protein AB7E76_02890 [Deferribacterales bacterium]
MSKYMTVDGEGCPNGFYDTSINTNIPEMAIEITDEQYYELINNQGARKWNGETVVEYIKELSAEEQANIRIAEIDKLLATNELACIRPLRAIAAGNGTAYDTQKLAELDTEAEALRIERASLVSE